MTLYTERCAVLANNVTNPCGVLGKKIALVLNRLRVQPTYLNPLN